MVALNGQPLTDSVHNHISPSLTSLHLGVRRAAPRVPNRATPAPRSAPPHRAAPPPPMQTAPLHQGEGGGKLRGWQQMAANGSKWQQMAATVVGQRRDDMKSESESIRW